jgi:hypothetical protein
MKQKQSSSLSHRVTQTGSSRGNNTIDSDVSSYLGWEPVLWKATGRRTRRHARTASAVIAATRLQAGA